MMKYRAASKKTALDYFQAIKGEKQSAEHCDPNSPICVNINIYASICIKNFWKGSQKFLGIGVVKSKRNFTCLMYFWYIH